jgi:hypothetical protein
LRNHIALVRERIRAVGSGSAAPDRPLVA